MGYTRISNELAENGVAVDLLSDGQLFVKIRAARSKVVEKERQKQQAPYRNMILAGRPLPAGVSVELGRKITANAVVVGIAGELPDGTKVGRIEGVGDKARPVEFGTIEPEKLCQIFFDYPDFEEDVSSASMVSATFAAPGTPVDAPPLQEAIEDAAKNS